MTDQAVPSVRELLALNDGYVFAVAWDAEGNPTKFHVTDKGHAHLGAIMRENALAAIARGETAWRQPPSRTDLGGAVVEEKPTPRGHLAAYVRKE